MKLQKIIIITNKESLESFPYSNLTGIIRDFGDIGKSESWLRKQEYPIELEKYRIDKKPLKKTNYAKTNFLPGTPNVEDTCT
jgi:hypothetical protein